MSRVIVAFCLGGILSLGACSFASGAEVIPKAAADIRVSQNWSGFFAGASLGARFADNDWRTSDVMPLLCSVGLCFFPSAGTGGSMNSAAGRVGAYGGYNWQVTPTWLVGIESDFGSASNSKTSTAPGTIGTILGGVVTNPPTATVKDTWDASVRGRLGMLLPSNTLLFATGGPTWQRVQLSASCIVTGSGTDFCSFPHNESDSKTLLGWTVGGGIEQKLSANWLVRLDYRYADYGTYNQLFFNAFSRAPLFDDRFTAHVKVQTQTANVGLAYKF